MTEFSALREEISQRVTLQFQFVLGNITAVGVILAIAFNSLPASGHVDSSAKIVLLLIPPISMAFFMLVIDQWYQMQLLGGYIRGVLRPLIKQHAASAQVVTWELVVERAQSRRSRYATFTGIGLFTVFFGPPAAALWLGWPGRLHVWDRGHLSVGWPQMYWALDLFVVLAGLVVAILASQRDVSLPAEIASWHREIVSEEGQERPR